MEEVINHVYNKTLRNKIFANRVKNGVTYHLDLKTEHIGKKSVAKQTSQLSNWDINRIPCSRCMYCGKQISQGNVCNDCLPHTINRSSKRDGYPGYDSHAKGSNNY